MVHASCLLCRSDLDSRNHIFFGCSYADEVWSSFFTHHSLSSPLDFDDIVNWVKSASRNNKLYIICKLVLQGTIYELWRERNTRLHLSSSKSSNQLSREIRQLIRSKLAGFDSPFSLYAYRTDYR